MSPATTTTITGVTILAKKRRRRADVFDITLSHEGIDIKRPGRNEQRLNWDRISQWEIAEHRGFVVLTLRGDGAVTPLVVKGWTLDDLEVVMRDVTSSVQGPVPTRTMPATPAPEPAPAPAPAPPSPSDPSSSDPPPSDESSPESRTARRHRIQQRRRTRWKPVVTVILLVALVAAVTLVLLQSSGAISWGFLGPTA
jgi:hypothetical protein